MAEEQRPEEVQRWTAKRRAALGAENALRARPKVSSNAFFAASKKSVYGSIMSPASAKPAPPLLTGSNGTTLDGHARPSTIAARDYFARYNPNSWLEIGGVCMDPAPCARLLL